MRAICSLRERACDIRTSHPHSDRPGVSHATQAIALFTAILLTAATAACGDDDGGSAAPGQPDKVKAGVIAILDVAPIYLGKQKGFFSKRNIDLTLETGQGGSQIAPNVLSGQYQFGFSNVVSLLLAKSQNAPLKVVSNGVNSTGDPKADFGGIVVKDPAITSAKGLEGRKVVLEDVGVDLPGERDQLTTRSDPRFVELRAHVYARIQKAKQLAK